MSENTLFTSKNYPLIAAPERIPGAPSLKNVMCTGIPFIVSFYPFSFSMILWELYTVQLLTVESKLFQPLTISPIKYVDGFLPLPSDAPPSVVISDPRVNNFRQQIVAGYRPPLPEPGTFFIAGFDL